MPLGFFAVRFVGFFALIDCFLLALIVVGVDVLLGTRVLEHRGFGSGSGRRGGTDAHRDERKPEQRLADNSLQQRIQGGDHGVLLGGVVARSRCTSTTLSDP